MTIPGSVFSPPLRDKFEAPEVFLGPAGLALDHRLQRLAPERAAAP